MKEIVIYEFQLKSIVEALRLTNNLRLKPKESQRTLVVGVVNVNYITGKSIKNKP